MWRGCYTLDSGHRVGRESTIISRRLWNIFLFRRETRAPGFSFLLRIYLSLCTGKRSSAESYCRLCCIFKRKNRDISFMTMPNNQIAKKKNCHSFSLFYCSRSNVIQLYFTYCGFILTLNRHGLFIAMIRWLSRNECDGNLVYYINFLFPDKKKRNFFSVRQFFPWFVAGYQWSKYKFSIY